MNQTTKTNQAAIITDEMMEYLGILAKLELTAEEKSHVKKGLEEMLSYMDKLNEQDVSGIEPAYQLFPSGNVFREDIVTNEDHSQDVLFHAPFKKENCFVVPKTIEGEDII